MSKQPPNRLITDDEDETPAAPAAAAPARTEAPRAPAAEPAPEADRGARTKGRGSYPGRRQVTAHIDRQLFLWLKRISAESEKPMVEIFEEALSAYVNSYAAQRKFGGGS